jgi:hypothetical protein
MSRPDKDELTDVFLLDRVGEDQVVIIAVVIVVALGAIVESDGSITLFDTDGQDVLIIVVHLDTLGKEGVQAVWLCHNTRDSVATATPIQLYTSVVAPQRRTRAYDIPVWYRNPTEKPAAAPLARRAIVANMMVDLIVEIVAWLVVIGQIKRRSNV